MPWVRLDDGFGEHPKVVAAGPLAGWLYVMGLGYCNRNQTDGFIPAAMVRRLADVDDALALAQRLVEAGLWEPTDGGYAVHDYLDYQASREHIQAVGEARAEAGRKGGQQKASNLLGRGLKQTASKTLAHPNPKNTPNPKDIPSTEETTARDAREAPAAPAVVAGQPYDLWLALCEESGSDPSASAPAYRNKQLAVAKRLLEQGYGEDKVRRCLRYLKSQEWRTSPIDLLTVEKEAGKWELAGMPATAAARASPNGRHSKLSSVDTIREGLGLTDDRGRIDEGHGAAAAALAAPGRQPADGGRAPPALP